MSCPSHKLIFLSVLWLVALSMTVTHAADFSVSPGDKAVIDITQDIGLFYDYSKSLSLEQVRTLSDDQFMHMNGVVSDGFRDANIWIRFRLDMASATETTWYLYERWFSNDKIILYSIDEYGDVSSQVNGNLSINVTPYESRKFNFVIDNQQGQASGEYYLRLEAYDPTLYGFALATEKAFGESIARENLIFGLYYGAMIIVVLFALVFSPFSPVFLYFSVFAASITWWNFVLNGFQRQFLGPTINSNEVFGIDLFEHPAVAFNYAGILVIVTFTLFSRKLFQFNVLPWFDRVIHYTFYFGIACCLVLLFIRDPLVSTLAYSYFTLTIVLVFGFSIWNLIARERTWVDLLLPLPFLALAVSLILKNAGGFSWIQSGFIMRHGVQIASIVSLLLFSFILNSKAMYGFKSVYDEKKDQNKAGQAKQAAFNQIIDRLAADLAPRLEEISGLCEYGGSHQDRSIRATLRSIDTLSSRVKKSLVRLSELMGVKFDDQIEKKEVFSLREILKQVHQQFIKHAYDSNINFGCHFSNAIPGQLLGDPNRIKKLLELLVENAINHSGSDRISVKAEIESMHSKSVNIALIVDDQGTVSISPWIAQILIGISNGNYCAAYDLPSECFGLRIVAELVNQLHGRILFEEKKPGLRISVKLELSFIA